MMDLKFSRFFRSKTGIQLLSIMLGLGVAGLFKMSCDSRSCIVYKGPKFEQDNKMVRFNNECYKVEENLVNCDTDLNTEKIML
jgi:hypothetical protein